MTTYTIPETQHNYAYELNQNSVRSFIHYDASDKYYIVVSEKETESEEPDEFYFRSRNKARIVHYLESLYNESVIVLLRLYDYDTLPSETSFDFFNNWSRVPSDMEVPRSIYISDGAMILSLLKCLSHLQMSVGLP
jgi:hypothetical protein